MHLTDQQIETYRTEGYLFLPNIFSAAEVAALNREVPDIFAMDRKEIVREKDGKTARTAFAAQHFSEPFRRLSRHPRLIEPVRRLLDGDVYIHQFKINAKAAFDGDVWQWHQDYGTWARDDLMPEPRALNIALFLEDVTEFNGALMFIPRSHRHGKLDAGHDVKTTSYPLWTLDNETVSRLVDEGGLVAPTGPAGSVLMFDCNLVHGSPSNMSPFDRTIVYVSLCHVDNHIRRFKRPDWIAERDFTPIESLSDDCLAGLARETAAAE
ncbi:MAG: phytanoyl-CoA dioxygenase family protein [Minwuiales bacterium]|nr:phytanoyl-CoA dioxygenase family protein [Minwuiales bacterium]